MADRELIAAILTAGMLPTLGIPRSRLERRSRTMTRAEAEAIQRAVDHASGLYRLVLNELGVDPFAFETEPGSRPRTQTAAARDGITQQFGHDAPGREEPACRASGVLAYAAGDPRDH